MQNKICIIRLDIDKSCTRYSRKYSFTIYMLQSCELSTPQSRHVCSKLSEVIAGCADAPHIVLCVLREEGEGEEHDRIYSEIALI